MVQIDLRGNIGLKYKNAAGAIRFRRVFVLSDVFVFAAVGRAVYGFPVRDGDAQPRDCGQRSQRKQYDGKYVEHILAQPYY